MEDASSLYPLEKFGLAVEALAISPRSIQLRLQEAFRHFAFVPSSQMPTHLQERFKRLRLRMTGEGGEGAVAQTTAQIVDKHRRNNVCLGAPCP